MVSFVGVGLLICRLALAVVFVFAGAAKLLDLAGSRRAVAEFGVPEQLAPVVAVLLPLAEIAVGVALVPVASARFGAIGAAALLIAFSVGIVNAMVHGRSPDCHCFGQVHSAPVGWRTLVRNLVLLALALFVAVAGWDQAGDSATGWVGHVGAVWVVAGVAGAVIVLLVAFQVWFCLQLLSQNGRTLDRLEALEGTLRAMGPWADGAGAPAPPLGAGLRGGGLPVGSPAPGFEAEGVDGGRYSLGSLLAPGRRLMLVFSAAGCGPCTALMPRLAGWQREFAGQLQIALIASGDREANSANAREHGLQGVLLEAGRVVSDAYQAHGTPMAVVIDPDGLIASPTVGGVEAIATLTGQAARPVLAIQQHRPSANGHAHDHARVPDGDPGGPGRSGVGEPAPDLVLPGLDGRPVALKDLYAERTVAIFWNPGCGFCQRMLPALRAFESNPGPGSPRLVVISSGEADAIREQQIASLVLLDTHHEAMPAFAVDGTPMGVLVDQGRIASAAAAGADAVFELIARGTVLWRAPPEVAGESLAR